MNHISSPFTPWRQPGSPIIVRLTGVSYGDAQKNIKAFGSPDIRWFPLVRERDNPHDPNAIKVALFGQFEMGYIPRDTAAELAPMMDAGQAFDAEFISVNRHPNHDLVGLTVKIVETESLYPVQKQQ